MTIEALKYSELDTKANPKAYQILPDRLNQFRESRNARFCQKVQDKLHKSLNFKPK